MTAVLLQSVSLWRRTQEELSYDLKRTILHVLERRYRRPPRRRVLHNISLQIERGEKVGIIGPNGSGKSTLLKLICGILTPTKGHVYVSGRIAPLIELGAGFDADITVADNIVYYGVMLGFSKKEMQGRIDPILDFAELAEYRNEPLKTLSSGMVTRLGFAIATEQRPEILILDEVLSVGDESFKIKCMQRIQDFWDHSSTIIVVSHDMTFIAAQCSRAVWLEHGEIVYAGPASQVTQLYLESVYGDQTTPLGNSHSLSSDAEVLGTSG